MTSLKYFLYARKSTDEEERPDWLEPSAGEPNRAALLRNPLAARGRQGPNCQLVELTGFEPVTS